MSNNPTRFFGLRKHDVTTFLKDLKLRFTQELNEIERKIKEVRDINTEIRTELERLENKQRTDTLQDEPLSYATEHLSKLMEIIERHFKDEIQAHYQTSNAEISKLEEEYQKLTLEITNGQKVLDGVIHQYSNVIENLSSKHLEKELKPIFNQFDNEFVESIQLQEPQVSTFKESDFWGDLGYYIAPEVSPEPKPANLQNENILGEEDSSQIEHHLGSHQEGTIPHKNDQPQELFETEKNNEGSIIKERTPYTERPRSDIDDDLENIRQRYMIGKLSGIDLYDSNGDKICSVNETITHEVVEKANQSGLLPELIVNMKLSGIGD